MLDMAIKRAINAELKAYAPGTTLEAIAENIDAIRDGIASVYSDNATFRARLATTTADNVANAAAHGVSGGVAIRVTAIALHADMGHDDGRIVWEDIANAVAAIPGMPREKSLLKVWTDIRSLVTAHDMSYAAIIDETTGRGPSSISSLLNKKIKRERVAREREAAEIAEAAVESAVDAAATEAPATMPATDATDLAAMVRAAAAAMIRGDGDALTAANAMDVLEAGRELALAVEYVRVRRTMPGASHESIVARVRAGREGRPAVRKHAARTPVKVG